MNFLRRLRNKTLSRIATFKEMPFVVSVNFETTALCNFKCVMCPVASQKVERYEKVLSLDVFKETIDNCTTLVSVGLNNWGEPLLHPQITEMVEYAYSKGLWTIFATNASLLTKELSRIFIEIGLTNIEFSVDGIGDTYRSIRNVAPELVIENINYFVNENRQKGSPVKTAIVITLSNLNEAEIEETIKVFREKVDEIRIQPCLTFSPYKRKNPCSELINSHLVVLSDGRVSPCCADFSGSLVIGNVLTDSLNAIYNGSEMLNLRRRHKQGRFNGACLYCFEYESKYVKKRFED